MNYIRLLANPFLSTRPSTGSSLGRFARSLQPEESRVAILSMLFLFRCSAILPAWLVIFGLLALLASPMTVATGLLLFFAGVVPPAIMFVLWKEPPPTVAEVLYRVEATRRA